MLAKPHRWTLFHHQRIKARHTRSSLARALDVSVSQVSRIEAGLRRPSPDLFHKIAAELDVSIDDLIATAPVPPPTTTTRVAS